MRSWHDFRIHHYRIEDVHRRITLAVAWPDPASSDACEMQNASVIFTGVQDYFLERTDGDHVMYSISDALVESFLDQSAGCVQPGKKWAAPTMWRGFLEDTLLHLQEPVTQYFDVSCAHGLRGWIRATKVEYLELVA